MSSQRLRRLLALPAALAVIIAGTFSAHAATQDDAPLEGLTIVISNDDSMQNSRPNGSDGEGLYELRKVFCEAGADVVVVAPWGYQSGAGSAVTNSGVFQLQEPAQLPERYATDCDDAPSEGVVFGVCQPIDGVCTEESVSATPVDTVKLAVRGGLDHVLGWEGNPDLVLSGINSGPNLGSSVNDSGTAGAALSALSVNVPGFAVSAAATGEDHQEVYERAAQFTVQYVAEVLRQDALTTDYVTNINLPQMAADEDPAGVVLAPVGTGTTARHSYEPSGELTFDVGLRGCDADDPTCVPETRDDADYLMNRAGYITITPLTPDRTYIGETTAIDSVIDSLALDDEPTEEPTQPGTDPEGGAPGTDPEGADPEGTDPDATDPGGSDTDATDPEGTDPDGDEPPAAGGNGGGNDENGAAAGGLPSTGVDVSLWWIGVALVAAGSIAALYGRHGYVRR